MLMFIRKIAPIEVGTTQKIRTFHTLKDFLVAEQRKKRWPGVPKKSLSRPEVGEFDMSTHFLTQSLSGITTSMIQRTKKWMIKGRKKSREWLYIVFSSCKLRNTCVVGTV
jgi:hypothetical protein